ncbi:hypothetical protein K435DRAFT_803637 [Dendrothele bispora CBS 962.96]|uniref:Uncharacterized protein n=1 Tax=Dendrothele bispora (strain CBS 962.96) TaxID=1314807 RepID=A0A4S8LGV6_DENBC|nr:hypothetical protein K435DRAFT_803637 [Dendrothele bispora CBS 962.96]
MSNKRPRQEIEQTPGRPPWYRKDEEIHKFLTDHYPEFEKCFKAKTVTSFYTSVTTKYFVRFGEDFGKEDPEFEKCFKAKTVTSFYTSVTTKYFVRFGEDFGKEDLFFAVAEVIKANTGSEHAKSLATKIYIYASPPENDDIQEPSYQKLSGQHEYYTRSQMFIMSFGYNFWCSFGNKYLQSMLHPHDDISPSHWLLTLEALPRINCVFENLSDADIDFALRNIPVSKRPQAYYIKVPDFKVQNFKDERRQARIDLASSYFRLFEEEKKVWPQETHAMLSLQLRESQLFWNNVVYIRDTFLVHSEAI